MIRAILQVTRVKYIGSIIQNDGKIEEDISYMIQVGWSKWRSVSGIICDKKNTIKA